MAEINYTLLGDRKKLEKYIKNNPDFKSSIRFEAHPSKEGVVYLHDETFWFGNLKADDFEKMAKGEIEYYDVAGGPPEVLKHITCSEIKHNTKVYAIQTKKTPFQHFKDRLAKYLPSKKHVGILICLIIPGIICPLISLKIFSKSKKGYSETFYISALAAPFLAGLESRWITFAEKKDTFNKKMADFMAAEIKQFSKEVNRERLTPSEVEKLNGLLKRVETYENK